MQQQKGLPYIIAFEGMPRSGKSTTLGKIKQQKDLNIIIFDELYFTKEQLKNLKDKRGTLDQSKWFLDREAERLGILQSMDLTDADVIVVDRMYLSTLAYCYARSQRNKSKHEFEALVKYYDSTKGQFLKYDAVIIFDTSIENSQSERRPNRESKEREYWMDTNFMKHYQSFYKETCLRYTDAVIYRIDSNKYLLGELYDRVWKIILDNHCKYK